MNKYVMAYCDLFTGTTELIVVEAVSVKYAEMAALEKKGWDASTPDMIGSICDVSWSQPVLVSSL